jgi:hypothetical protein
MDPDHSSATTALFEAMRDLHERNDFLSAREIEARVGRRLISHDTVNKAVRGHSVISWKKLSLIVSTLAGDLDQFEKLWRAARAERVVDVVGDNVAADVGGEPAVATDDPADEGAAEVEVTVDALFPVAGRSPVNISREAFEDMLANYRPDRVEDIRRITYVLLHVGPLDAVTLLTQVPRRLAAHALAHLDGTHGRAVTNEVDDVMFSELVDHLDDAQDLRRRLERRRVDTGADAEITPSPLPRALGGNYIPPHLQSSPALQELADVLSHYPYLASQWNAAD